MLQRKLCMRKDIYTLQSLGCRQFRDSRASKKASSWKVMSCIEDKENIDPHPTKKCKLSLSLKNRDRFKAITDKKLDTMSKPQVPKNTKKSNRWAMTNLREWYDDYNDRNSSAKCPEELLSPEASKEVLNTWLCVFITETRGKNGEPSCLQRPSNSYFQVYFATWKHNMLIIWILWIRIILVSGFCYWFL